MSTLDDIVRAVLDAAEDLEPETRSRFLFRMEDVFLDLGNLGHELRIKISDSRRAK